jgi:MFS family permease
VSSSVTEHDETHASTTRSLVVDVVVVLAAFLLVGALAGLVWPHLVDPVVVTRAPDGVASDEVALAERFDNDGWYMVLAGGCGLLLGLVLTIWRRTHEVVTLLAVVAGAFLAAWVMAGIGRLVGPEDPERVLADARVGTTASGVVTVTAEGAHYVWPIAAVIGALIVLWSPPGQRLLRRT